MVDEPASLVAAVGVGVAPGAVVLVVAPSADGCACALFPSASHMAEDRNARTIKIKTGRGSGLRFIV
jgi:hypothetical protein